MPQVLAAPEPQKAIVTVFDAVGVTPVIEFGFVAELLFVGAMFTPHKELLLLGLKTYIATDNEFTPAPMETEGFPTHVPLNLHQYILTV